MGIFYTQVTASAEIYWFRNSSLANRPASRDCESMFTIATFNVENLMRRFDFSGFRNELHQDRALQLFEISDEAQYRLLEQARAVAHADDTRQMTALAIAETRADILCLQEVDNLAALNAFEYGYLFKMIGHGFRHKYLIDGNDSRGIDVAVMMRDTTRDGQPIEVDEVTSYAYVTYNDFGLYEPVLGELGLEPHDRIFKRDCLNLDIELLESPYRFCDASEINDRCAQRI